ncbi:hypothetical protein CHS0354_018972 [Potamilus streckersoni]|uniref:Uncharacterized protein n=1 Tax=Potamilus streckersoni TaxID=2493646 RepID=A0AAE0SMT7_9BIVA|nr:hypothetical protein CHS0354_018972 [Potamilus streckersoni]
MSSCILCPNGTTTLITGSISSTQCVATCNSGFFRTTNGSCEPCPVGTYQSSTEQPSCLSCPLGTTTNQIASTSNTQCIDICSAGFFLNNLNICEACPSGTYQPSPGQTSCISCLTGTVTLQAGSTSSMQCVATCNSGFFRTTNGSCEACPVGTYQSSTEQLTCLSCPLGTTTNQVASTSNTQCIDTCSAGFFLNNLNICEACPSGTYQSSAGQASCISCQTGSVTLQAGSTSPMQCVAMCDSGFFRTTSGSCVTCPVGTYQSSTEQSSCLSCPGGTTTNQVASTSKTQCVGICSAGFFLNKLDSCEACPSGTYQPSNGQTSCISCLTGTVTLQAGSTSSEQCVVVCSSGFFRTTSGSCEACPVGTYQASVEQSYCLSCPTGTSTNQSASTSLTQCVVNNCPAGTYQAFSGSPCIPCAAGTYQPQPRQTTCIQCPTGKYQPNINSTECIRCGPGSYQNSTGSSSCIRCNSGTYQSIFEQTSCIQCAAGTSQPNTGTSTECTPCNPGSYQNKTGSYSCILCEAGTYQPNPGQSNCPDCHNGTYQGQKGSTICVSCEAGTYQPDHGKAACIACPSGTSQGQNGSTSCVKCNPGFYQNSTGEKSCSPCTVGHYNSVSGHKSCRPCEIGTFQNSTGQSFCFPCPNKYTTQQRGEQSIQGCFQGFCLEYRYTINVSTYNISVIIPSTKINQTGYSWDRCKKDSSKALVSAFCHNISRTEVTWTQEKVECIPEPEIQDNPTSPISEKLHTISKIDVNDTNLVNILQTTNELVKSVKVLMPVDVGYLADILDKVNMVDSVSKEVLNATLDVINTLLRSNSSTNQSAQESPGAANRILKIFEDITSKTVGGTVDNPVRTIKSNIAVTVWEQVGGKLIGIIVKSGNTDGIQDNVVKQLEEKPKEMAYLDDAIYFETDILNGTRNKLVMTALWNDALFMFGRDRYKVVSTIMAAKLIQNGVSITSLGNNYVESVFHVTEEDTRITCGYWDYTLNQNGGGWDSEGCNYTKEGERHVCSCNHLTNFAILVDLDANIIPAEHAQALEIITYIGLILSIIGLSLTIITFICFRHLRRGRGQQTLFCLCIPMVCYSIVFLVGIQRTEHYAPCIVVSVLMHYFILASFMWMLVEGILQYLRFVKVLGTYIPKFLIKTSIPAWGIPLIPVIVMLAYDYNLYYGGSRFCWMKLEALYYAFLLPVCLIVLVNAIIFTIVICKIFRRPKGMKINQSERKMIVLNLQAGLSVFVVLGLTWIFGVIALGGAKLTFQYIFVILNAFQGFFIFLLFTAREKQIRDQWIRFCCRRPTGYFTSFERKSSSQDTFTTTVSGRKLSSSSGSFTDNRDHKVSSSSQDHRRRSSLPQINESVQEHVRQNRSVQQLEIDRQSADSVEKEIAFSSLQEHKKEKTSPGKYMKASKASKYKSSAKDDADELKKTCEHTKSNVNAWGNYLSKSVPDHTNSKHSLADPSGRQKVKGGRLDEARSNIILFNSLGRSYTSTYRNDIQGEKVLSAFGRSLDNTHDKQKRRHITQIRHGDAYF